AFLHHIDSRIYGQYFLKDLLFFFSSRRRHTSFSRDWSSDVCSSDLRMGSRSLSRWWTRWSRVSGTWRSRSSTLVSSRWNVSWGGGRIPPPRAPGAPEGRPALLVGMPVT